MRRLVHADSLVRSLTAENETLVTAIQTLEDSIRMENDDEGGSSRRSSSSSNTSSDGFGSKECLDFVHEALCGSLGSDSSSSTSGEVELLRDD